MGSSKSFTALSMAVGAVLALMPLHALAQGGRIGNVGPNIMTPSSQPSVLGGASAMEGLTGISVTEGGGLVLNFQTARVTTVLKELSEAAGYIIIYDVDVDPAIRVTLVSRQPIPRADAITMLNAVLSNSQLVAVPRGERILKVTTKSLARFDLIPVRIGINPIDIPNVDELVTQIMPLQNLDVAQVYRELASMFSSEATVVTNSGSNSLIVTDTSAHIRKLADILVKLDSSPSEALTYKVFELRYAAASSVATIITNQFRQQTGGATGGAAGGGGMNQMLGGGTTGGGAGGRGGTATGGRGGTTTTGGGGANLARQRATQVNATAADTTNAVIVSATAEMMRQIEEIITYIDKEPDIEESFYIYHLKNGDASNVASVANNLFNGTGSTTGTTGARTTGTSTTARTTGATSSSSRSTGTGNRTSSTGRLSQPGAAGANRVETALSGAEGGAGGGGGGTTARGGATGGTGTTARGATGTNAMGGGTTTGANRAGSTSNSYGIYFTPDTMTNSLLIRANPKYKEQIFTILDELDRAVPQVLIKVLIAEVTHDKSTDLGAELSMLNIRESGLGQSAGTNFGLANSAGGVVLKFLEQDFSATIRALETSGKLDVLSRPYILASDNQPAYILVGQQVPFVTNSQISDTGSITNTIQYSDIGISIDVTPQINPDGLVKLSIAPQISALSSSTIQISNGINAPVFTSRQANTVVSVRNGHTVVIGGLMQDQISESINKVPLLGDIPILGELFKRTQSTKTKTELLIFLTPHVATAPEKLRKMSEEETDHTSIVPKAVYPGAFQEHMQGMEAGAAEPDPERQRVIQIAPPAARSGQPGAQQPGSGAGTTPRTVNMPRGGDGMGGAGE